MTYLRQPTQISKVCIYHISNLPIFRLKQLRNITSRKRSRSLQNKNKNPPPILAHFLLVRRKKRKKLLMMQNLNHLVPNLPPQLLPSGERPSVMLIRMPRSVRWMRFNSSSRTIEPKFDSILLYLLASVSVCWRWNTADRPKTFICNDSNNSYKNV